MRAADKKARTRSPMLEDRQRQDANRSRVPAAAGPVRRRTEPDRLTVETLKDLGGIDDRAVLAARLAVISSNADRRPGRAKSSQYIGQLVVEHLLEAYEGRGTDFRHHPMRR